MTTDPFEDAAPAGEIDDPFEDAGEAEPGPVIEEGDGTRKMPDPLDGVRKTFTRASKFGGVIADDYTLVEWKIAMAVLGTAKNRDIYAMANAEPMPTENMEDRPKGWWLPWATYGHEAMDAVRASSGAHLGTAIHSWVDQIEAGTIRMRDIPEEWREHVKAHLRVHKENGMKYIPEMRERLIVNRGLHKGVSGKFDALRGHTSGAFIIDDTKTGKNAPMGLDEIAVQLAIYANAEYFWTPEAHNSVHGYLPAPVDIHKKIATVTWVPVNNPDRADVIPIDIEAGWEAAQQVAKILEYRNRSKRVAGSKLGSVRLSKTALKSA